MELAWANALHQLLGIDILILTPLAVARQMIAEGAAMGIEVHQCRSDADVKPGINVTNYERLHKFTPARFGAVVLDESSCIKHHDTKTLQTLLDAFGSTPYKLCASATPAPNDWTELGTHAEFLGVCKRVEMLSEYFVHDGAETQVWRLKGHAQQDFWQWVASWAAMVRRPSDLGFDDSAYLLPPLVMHEHIVESPDHAAGTLFKVDAQTLMERRNARRSTIQQRVAKAVEIILGDKCEPKNRPQNTTSRITLNATTEIQSSERDDKISDPELLKKTAYTCGNTSSGLATSKNVLQSRKKGTWPKDERNTPQTQPSENQERSKPGSTGLNTQTGPSPKILEPTDSPQNHMHLYSNHRREDAESAGRLKALTNRKDLEPASVASTSTIATSPAKSEDCCAALAILDLESSPMTHSDCKEPWIIWCDLNSEQDALERYFGDIAFSVRGSMEIDEKESAILGWIEGQRPIMISKPSIMGWGVNAQHCCNMAFVGVTDSYEAFYQSVRRIYRFGQKRPVHVHVIASDIEGAVLANLRRKEADATAMAEALSAYTKHAVMQQVFGSVATTNEYRASQKIIHPIWLRTEAQ